MQPQYAPQPGYPQQMGQYPPQGEFLFMSNPPLFHESSAPLPFPPSFLPFTTPLFITSGYPQQQYPPQQYAQPMQQVGIKQV